MHVSQILQRRRGSVSVKSVNNVYIVHNVHTVSNVYIVHNVHTANNVYIVHTVSVRTDAL